MPIVTCKGKYVEILYIFGYAALDGQLLYVFETQH